MRHLITFLFLLTLCCTVSNAQSNDYVSKSLRHSKKGGELYAKGKYTSSIKAYSKAITAYPELEYNYYHRGLAYKAQGDLKMAFADFDKGILFNTSTKECYYERGLIYLHYKRYKEAIKDFENHLILIPDDIAATEMLMVAFKDGGHPVEALRTADKLLKLDSKAVPALHLILAQALSVKNLELAKLPFAQLSACNDNSVETQMLTAEYYLLAKENDMSIAILKEVLTNIYAIPHHAQAFYLYANASAAKGQKTEALNGLSRAILLHPSITYYYDRGCIAAETGNTQLALLDFSTVILLDSTHKGAYNNRTFYIWFPQQKYKEAVADLDQIIALDSTNAFAYSNRSYAYYGLKMYDRGLTDGLTAVKLEPKNPYAYKNLALLYYAKGLKEDAIEMAKGALHWRFPLETDNEFLALLNQLELDY